MITGLEEILYFCPMDWNSAIKAELIARHSPRHDPKDTGSPESQIALLTYRIQEIANHLKEHPKDFSAHRGLFRLVGQRKRLLAYLKRTDIKRYRTIISVLGKGIMIVCKSCVSVEVQGAAPIR